MATNQTPVEYCRHCGKEIERCPEKCGHYRCNLWRHSTTVSLSPFCVVSLQVAEPADPPQQQVYEKTDSPSFIFKAESAKVKAGTQMEERKPDAIINFVQDMIDRAENAHESKPGICVEIPVFMADIARIKQTLRTDVSESANREPQASRERWLLECIQDLRDRNADAERELQELRGQLGLIRLAVCDPKKAAAGEVLSFGKSVELIIDKANEADSLRGLVGRMLDSVIWFHIYERTITCQVCGGIADKPATTKDIKHHPDCEILEAEAAIKEPHNG